jgi:hypothetical protein
MDERDLSPARALATPLRRCSPWGARPRRAQTTTLALHVAQGDFHRFMGAVSPGLLTRRDISCAVRGYDSLSGVLRSVVDTVMMASRGAASVFSPRQILPRGHYCAFWKELMMTDRARKGWHRPSVRTIRW